MKKKKKIEKTIDAIARKRMIIPYHDQFVLVCLVPEIIKITAAIEIARKKKKETKVIKTKWPLE